MSRTATEQISSEKKGTAREAAPTLPAANKKKKLDLSSLLFGPALPAAIEEKLDLLARRIRRVRVARGLFIVLAVAAFALLSVMAVDAGFVIFSDAVRAALSGAALLAVLVAVWLFLIRPFRKKFTPAEIARILETRHPELEERLSTAVSLLSVNIPEYLRGSQELLDAVVRAAETDAGALKARREFPAKKARRLATVALGAASVIGIALALWPGPAGRLVTRALNPVARVGNLFADRLHVAPGSLTIAEGEPLTITLETTDDAERAELRARFPEKAETVERMALLPTRDPENPELRRFTVTFPSARKSFRYRVRSGRALSAYYEVRVIPRPVVEEITLEYTFPEYTGLPPKTVKASDGAIAAVAGTQVAVSARVDRPMKTPGLLINETPVWTNSQSGEGGKPVITWKIDLRPDMTGVWKISLEDYNGIHNRPVEYPINVAEDAPPTLRIITPESRDLNLKPNDILSIGYLANDDFGITAARVILATVDGDLPAVEQPLPVAQETPGDWIGEATLDLKKLDLGGQRDVEIRVALSDGLGQEALSDPLVVHIRDDAKSLLEQNVAKQAEEYGQAIWEALQKLNAAKQLANDKPAALVAIEGELPKPLVDDIATARTNILEAETLVTETARNMAATLFAKQGQALDAVARDFMAPARQAAEEIPLADSKVTRVHQSRLLARNLEDAIAGLQDALRSLQSNADNAQSVAKMNEFTDKQRELAELIADPRNAAILADLQGAQKEMAERMAEMLAENQQSLAERFLNTRENANELAEAAKALAADQDMLAKLLEKALDPAAREDAALDMLQWLEGEQREIGADTRGVAEFVTGNDPALRLKLEDAARTALNAADLITQAKLEDAVEAALANVGKLEAGTSGDPAVSGDLAHLLEWQESVAEQLRGLAANDVDSALAAMQQQLAAEAAKLAANSDLLQEAAAKIAASEVVRQALSSSEFAAAAAQAAAAAAAQLGGGAMGQFRFDQQPVNLPPGSNIPPNMPPAPTVAGAGDPGDMLAHTQFNSEAARAAAGGDLPPDIAALDGSRENPFSIGEASLDTLPPALKDEELVIRGGQLPPDYLPPVAPGPPGAGGVNPGGTSGQGSMIGSAVGSAQGAASGLSGAAGALASAANTLNNTSPPTPADMPPTDPQIAEAMKKAMEAETPREAAEAAEEAAVAMQSMMTQLSTENADAVKNWQRIRGKVESGIATESQGSAPAEYNDLVKRYFEEIAKKSQ